MSELPIWSLWRKLAAFCRNHPRQVLALVFSIALTVLVVVFQHEIAKVSSWGYLGVFVIDVLGNATVLFPVPSIAINFSSGGILNPWLVGIVAGVAEPIGELSGYLAGYGGSAVVENRPRYAQIKLWMEKRGFLTLFVLAAIPNPVFDIAGMTAGAMKYPLWKFLAACWLGKTVKATAIALIGSGLLPVITGWFTR